MADRWKLAAELDDKRDWTVIAALYDDTLKPVNRFTVKVNEGFSNAQLAEAFRKLADDIDHA